MCFAVDSIPDFDRENFLGKWYEISRYFTVSEALSKCVAVEYERRSDGRIYVNHENTNRLYVFIFEETRFSSETKMYYLISTHTAPVFNASFRVYSV